MIASARLLCAGALGAVTGVVACASSPSSRAEGSSQSVSQAGKPAAARDRSRMDTTDLRGSTYRNAYDAITATHPDWLRAAGGTKSLGGTGNGLPAIVGVFVDGSQRSMGVDYLKSLNVVEVREIKHLSASESLIHYGSEFAFGAIVVTLHP